MSLWSGRFRSGLHGLATAFSTSIDVDKRLYREDIEGSIAHAAMLGKQKIIPRRDARRIQKALREILDEIESGKLILSATTDGSERFVADDVHMAIEKRLIEKVGELGGKLHTGRSRNDQVALDERLYLRRSIHSAMELIRSLQKALVSKAGEYADVVMAGYTHLQRAQPILLAHHLLAYVSMLERDHSRMSDCLKRVNLSPLGAGALAGTPLRIDRKQTASALGFDGIIENSIDAVSDRDVLIEYISACAIVMMHLSRLAEELILWSSQEWRFVDLDDAFTTGSSIMPQKKNPDMAELVRGKSGRVFGDLVALLTVMKGLPLAYNRDMQEDKEPLFDAADTVADSLRITTLMMTSVKFNKSRFEKELQSDFLLATELADYLARRGVPFRKAHAIVGAIVQECIEQHLTLSEIPLKTYQRHSPLFSDDLYDVLDVRRSLMRKQSAGSTSPNEVKKSLNFWKKKLRA